VSQLIVRKPRRVLPSRHNSPEGVMKFNPRKLREDYDLLVWSGLFLCILALWSALFAVAIAYAILS
jgi:hypothetical protein